MHFTTLVMHFRCPLVRDYILLHGMLDCSRDTCKRVLTGCAVSPGPLMLCGTRVPWFNADWTRLLVISSKRPSGLGSEVNDAHLQCPAEAQVCDFRTASIAACCLPDRPLAWDTQEERAVNGSGSWRRN